MHAETRSLITQARITHVHEKRIANLLKEKPPAEAPVKEGARVTPLDNVADGAWEGGGQSQFQKKPTRDAKEKKEKEEKKKRIMRALVLACVCV